VKQPWAKCVSSLWFVQKQTADAMAHDDKVIWYEGMFLRPQHFQQQDRYLERLVRESARGLVPYGWGLRSLKLDRAQLEVGRFALTEVSGLFTDGTPFSAPQLDATPDALDLPDDAAGKRIFLAIPERRLSGSDFGGADEGEAVARYAIKEIDVFDAVEGNAQAAPVSTGGLRLRFLLEGMGTTGYTLLPVARVQEVRADRKVLLDEGFIPPLLNVSASPLLTGVMTELVGLLRHRGEAISGRLGGVGGARGVSDVSDFMMLQLVNRMEPVLAHLARTPALHPERLFCLALGLAGELSSFTAQTRRTPDFPEYRHDNLAASFRPVIASIRQSLSAVLEQPAVQIALQDRGHGVRVGVIADKGLIASAGFVLAVRADMPQEEIRTVFPRLVKIGPVEQIRELVNVAMPGIRIRPMPVAPRQIPFHSTAVYFELERGTPIWKSLAGSGGIAVHVAGEFRDLSIELWAIRG